MTAKLLVVRSILPLMLRVPLSASVPELPSRALRQQALVNACIWPRSCGPPRTHSHPMRYRLRKSSPRMTSTKDIVETRDGAVARLVLPSTTGH